MLLQYKQSANEISIKLNILLTVDFLDENHDTSAISIVIIMAALHQHITGRNSEIK